MAFAIMGSVGQVRHRIHPRKVKGPSGYKKGKSTPKVAVKRTHTVRPAAQKKNFTSRMAAKVRSLFGRGNR
jgi:hypothetical protein